MLLFDLIMHGIEGLIPNNNCGRYQEMSLALCHVSALAHTQWKVSKTSTSFDSTRSELMTVNIKIKQSPKTCLSRNEFTDAWVISEVSVWNVLWSFFFVCFANASFVSTSNLRCLDRNSGLSRHCYYCSHTQRDRRHRNVDHKKRENCSDPCVCVSQVAKTA